MSTAIQSGFFSRQTVVGLCWGWILALPVVVGGQTNYYATNGTEYAMVGSQAGDQVHPDVAVKPGGGFTVWQDNITDGDGWGVSTMQLNGTLSGSGSSFRVNVQGTGDQENPRVTLLRSGGAAFVWQGGPKGFQHIYARFLSASNTWLTGDVMVNTSTNYFQITPAVTTLTNGNVIVVWASYNEASAGSMQDVYGRIFSPAGTPVTGEFLINQFDPANNPNYAFNQRAPAVAALVNGGFIATWVSEQERTQANIANPAGGTPSTAVTFPSVDVYARSYGSSGTAQGNEFLVDVDSNPCDDPAVAAGSDGGFVIAWDARDLTSTFTNGLDIYARSFSSANIGGSVIRVNSYLFGDQFTPRIAALGTDYLIVWTSLAQDGSREGAYGQFLRGNGSFVGTGFRVNNTTAGSQIQPVVVSDGVSQFLSLWSSFTGLTYGFDLFAQRFINTLQPLEPLPAPFVYAPFVIVSNAYQPQLVVSWTPVTGLSISNYEIYLDGSPNPTAATSSNIWTMTSANGLMASSTHSFRVDYLTQDGRKSPLSPSASGTTWQGYNWGGIPFEWMTQYYGSDISKWPGANTVLAPGGPTLLQVFLSGGNPLDPGTWLRTTLSNTPQGLFLSWNTQPGLTYQVQAATNLGAWSNLGSPRFAAGTGDSIFIGKSSAGYYRVMLLRQ
jgi:hypothetical protein